MDINWGTVIIGVVPAIVTWFVARTDTKGNIQSKEVEVSATTEGLYIKHMDSLLEQYKERSLMTAKEIEDLRKENKEVIEKLEALQKQFDAFQSDHDVEIQEYKNTLMQKQDRIEDLKMEVLELVEKNEQLEEENGRLKEELDGKPIE